MKTKIIKPRIVAFEVTRRCRFACKHCRAEASPQGGEKELTTQQCEKILASVAKFGRCVIILTGGEPMERKDIYDLIRYCRKLRLRAVMATCGYLIDEQSIVKLKKAGIFALSFSIDGASADTNDAFRQSKGAFESAVQAAEIARKAGVRFQINSTITRLNIDESAGIAELARRLGAYCFNPFILVPTGRGAEIADELLEPVEYEAFLNELLQIKLQAKILVRVTCGPQFARVCEQAKEKHLISDVHGCMGGREFGFISYRGDVQTCGFLNISAGNLLKNRYNFAKIWIQSQLLESVRDTSSYKGVCGDCQYVGICGGCRARAYAISGDYLAADPLCARKKAYKD